VNLARLQTPCLVLDRDILQRNIERMRERMQALGVSLRPHIKTAKSVEVARLIMHGGSGPITVSTLREAEYFFAGGFADILYAVSVVPGKLDRVRGLMNAGCDLKLILDDAATAAEVANAGRETGATFKVLIEIDCDGHRAGLRPDDPAVTALAKSIHESDGIEFLGLMTHAGDSYSSRTTDEIRGHAAREVLSIVSAAGRIAAQGIPVPIRSVGSTPTASFVDDLSGISEVRAGVYVFQDLVMVGLGVCKLNDIAMSVLTTVVSHKRDHQRLIVDAGGIALSKDRGTAEQALDCGYGLVCDAASGIVIDGLIVSDVNQEHGLIGSSERELDFSRFPIGSQLRILPNHACMTAAAHECYQVVAGDGRVQDVWQRCQGW